MPIINVGNTQEEINAKSTRAKIDIAGEMARNFANSSLLAYYIQVRCPSARYLNAGSQALLEPVEPAGVEGDRCDGGRMRWGRWSRRRPSSRLSRGTTASTQPCRSSAGFNVGRRAGMPTCTDRLPPCTTSSGSTAVRQPPFPCHLFSLTVSLLTVSLRTRVRRHGVQARRARSLERQRRRQPEVRSARRGQTPRCDAARPASRRRAAGASTPLTRTHKRRSVCRL